MNAWVPRKFKLNEVIRVTAGGASKMLVHSDASPTIQTSLTGGSSWVDVSSWFTNIGTNLYSFITDPSDAAPKLLGPMLRITAGPSADPVVCQEE